MSANVPLSAVVTCYNSAATLERCLSSLAFCDELVVLDSGSQDASQDIARRHGARLFIEAFRGYAAQKQAAVDRAAHDWVLLLDSDEWLADDATEQVRTALSNTAAAGFSLRRREWLFWRWQHPRSRHNRYVRLFDRRRARMSRHAVHETVLTDGMVADLPVLLFHRGDPDIASKVAKANQYSSLQQADLDQRTIRWLRLRMLFYPALAFLRFYVLRGHWRSGWAGFIAAKVHAFYAFQKYAKAFERRHGQQSSTGRHADRDSPEHEQGQRIQMQ